MWTERPRPGELPDAGPPAPEPAKPTGRLSCLRFRTGRELVRLRAGPCARLVAVPAPAGGPTVPAALPARPRSARQLPGVRHVAAAAQRRERR